MSKNKSLCDLFGSLLADPQKTKEQSVKKNNYTLHNESGINDLNTWCQYNISFVFSRDGALGFIWH